MTTHNLHQLWKLMHELPSYVEVDVTYAGREMRVMTRDIPRTGRRCTNLTTGTEWFLPEVLPPDVTRLYIEAMEGK